MLLAPGEVSLIDLWISYWNHGGRCHPFVFDALIFDVLIVDGSELAALASAVVNCPWKPAAERSSVTGAVPHSAKLNAA
jgi:hypothetical protein